jgi:cephalosporin hydroxylase
MGAISRIITNEVGSRFQAAGINFQFINADFQRHKTDMNEIVILKPPAFLRHYDHVFEKTPTKNALEFGIFEGGSIILFALAYPNIKFVGIDIRPPNENVLRHIHNLGLAGRVKLYYETSQADSDKVDRIISSEFGGDDVGVISDDASHDYKLSKETFQLTFGKLAPGGSYCLEDWNWAHSEGVFQTQQWIDQPALTNLVFEIIMMYASTRGLIANIEFLVPALMCIRRGEAKLARFEFDNLIRMRNKTFTLI